MKAATIAALVLVIAFFFVVSMEVVSYYGKRDAVVKELEALREKVEKAKSDNDRLRADIEYYSRTENLEKELRARFNYRKVGEQMIILVPRSSSSQTFAPRQTSTPQ